MPRITLMPPIDNRGRRDAVLAVALAVITAIAIPTDGEPPADATAAIASPESTEAPTPPATAPLLDWSHTRRAYRTASDWVANTAVPKPETIEPIKVADLAGVRVTLRYMGQTVGIGDATFDLGRFDDASQPPARTGVDRPAVVRDLMQMVAAATARALDDAAAQLAHSQRAADASSPDDARQPIHLAQIARSLVLDVQLARTPKRVRIPRGSTGPQMTYLFAPGFHGLRLLPAAARRSGASAWSWPASNLAANIAPTYQLIALLKKLGHNPHRDLPLVGAEDGPVLEQFEVIHVTRAGVRHPVEQLVRGNVPIRRHDMSDGTLDNMAKRMARHLLDRQRADGSFLGAYKPTARAYKSPVATADHSAAAAYALQQFASAAVIAGAGREQLDADVAVHRAIERVVAALQDRKQPPQPRAMALTVMTIMDSRRLSHLKAARDDLAERLLSLRRDDGLFTNRPNEGKPLDITSQSMIIAALGQLHDQTRDAVLGNAVAESNDALVSRLGTDIPLTAAPWLILTQRHRLRHGSDADGHDLHVEFVGGLITSLHRRHIARPPAVGPADVLGGFDLPGAPAGDIAPQPDATSAAALLAFAEALAHPGLIDPDEHLRLQLEAALAARFIAQLMFDESNIFYVRQPAAALGGVRQSLFDNTLDLPATATSLAAIVKLRLAMQNTPE